MAARGPHRTRAASRRLPRRWTCTAARVVFSAALLGSGVLPAAAFAQGAGDAATDGYKQHMENGVKLFQDKNYEAAIAEFEAAYAARKKPSPLVNIALCYKGEFNYPKAIATLEAALARHAAAMSDEDQKAARDAIGEMKLLLAYVSVDLYPPQATLTIDGEAVAPGASARPIPVGPGTHRVSASADGFAGMDRPITVVSGEKPLLVSLRLVPDKGYVTVKGDDATMVIAVDSKALGTGAWAGLLAPGTHVVELYEPGGPAYRVNVLVVAGQSQQIRRGFGGVPVLSQAPPIAAPPAPNPEPPPEPPKRGPYAFVTGSLLAPTLQPVLFPDGNLTSGAAGGARVGFRVNTNAGFELMFEYGNVKASRANDPDARSSLSSTRFGLNLRLMTSGNKVRLVGALGGGIVNDSLTLTLSSDLRSACDAIGGTRCNQAKLTQCSSGSCSGLDAFMLAELGIELEFGGVLLGASTQSYFQATKSIEADAFESKPMAVLGGGLRIGYGLW